MLRLRIQPRLQHVRACGRAGGAAVPECWYVRPAGRDRSWNRKNRTAPELLVRQHRPLQRRRALRGAESLARRADGDELHRRCRHCFRAELTRRRQVFLQLPRRGKHAVVEQHQRNRSRRTSSSSKRSTVGIIDTTTHRRHPQDEEQAKQQSFAKARDDAANGRFLSAANPSADANQQSNLKVVAAVLAAQQMAAARPRLQNHRLQLHVQPKLLDRRTLRDGRGRRAVQRAGGDGRAGDLPAAARISDDEPDELSARHSEHSAAVAVEGIGR